MGVIIAIVAWEPRSRSHKRAWPSFPSIVENTWKQWPTVRVFENLIGPRWGFFKPHPPASRTEFVTETLRWKNSIFICLYYLKTITFCRMLIFLFPMVKIPFPDIFALKTQSANLFRFIILIFISVHLCAEWCSSLCKAPLASPVHHYPLLTRLTYFA